VKSPLVIDLDATLITAHSEKEQAAPTFKRGFGYHPLCAFLDHGSDGTGEPLAIQLRPGNAGSNTAADHITVTRQALAQLPAGLLARGGRGSKKILIRTDGAGGTKDFLAWLQRQRLAYSVGFTLPASTPDLLKRLDEAKAWTPAYDSEDEGIREGTWVAELTGLLDLQPVACRDAGDRAEGTSSSWGAAADHRSRRNAHHRVRHQHPARPATRLGAASPPPRALRRPDP
jgi:hypothetical protein